jgi:hypothetical protein
MKSWQQKILIEFGYAAPGVRFQRLVLEPIDSVSDVAKVRVQRLSKFGLRIIRKTESKLFLIPRHILSRLLPFDPLSQETPTPISATILASDKDLEVLPFSIAGLIYASWNPITSLTIVCPNKTKQKVEKILRTTNFSHKFKISISTDEEILAQVNLEDFHFVSSVAKMELLKLLIGYQSLSAVLVLDGDTLLLRPRNWISGTNQLTPVAQEYFLGHKNFSERILKLQVHSGFGYVTHHALFAPQQIQRIIDTAGGVRNLASEVNNGVEKGWGDWKEFPSEWQLYGDSFELTDSSMKQYPANFSNIGIDRKLLDLSAEPTESECLSLINRLKNAVPTLGSISLHDYK